jgi:hypothetical protein
VHHSGLPAARPCVSSGPLPPPCLMPLSTQRSSRPLCPLHSDGCLQPLACCCMFNCCMGCLLLVQSLAESIVSLSLCRLS